MRVRVKTFISAAERLSLSPLLPAAAVMLITVFTVSLALAEPQQVVAARGDASVAIGRQDNSTILNDAITENETAIFAPPRAPPRFRDRYRFYHRYDRYQARSRLSPGTRVLE